MSELAEQPPEGIRVVLNEEDVTDIQAIIEGPCKIKVHLKNSSCKISMKYYVLYKKSHSY